MLRLKRGDLFWVVFAVFIVVTASSLIEGKFSITGFVSLASEGDMDDDGVLDENDNCINVFNPDQTNSDEDGVGGGGLGGSVLAAGGGAAAVV